MNFLLWSLILIALFIFFFNLHFKNNTYSNDIDVKSALNLFHLYQHQINDVYTSLCYQVKINQFRVFNKITTDLSKPSKQLLHFNHPVNSYNHFKDMSENTNGEYLKFVTFKSKLINNQAYNRKIQQRLRILETVIQSEKLSVGKLQFLQNQSQNLKQLFKEILKDEDSFKKYLSLKNTQRMKKINFFLRSDDIFTKNCF